MKTVLSGIQPSGDMTLGNYLGAIKNHVKASKDPSTQSYYCVVDLHAITVRQDPKLLRERTYAVAAWYLAAGLDTDQSTLFVQSHVRAHTELAWLLSTFTQIGELERMTQYKDKSQRHKHNINAGLLTYPVLMAADILLYNATHVPVGDDQKQHLELTRDVAIRFNNHYKKELKKAKQRGFIIPEPAIPEIAARVMDLQYPENKMSKSAESAGTVLLADTPKQIEKAFKRAVTDNEANVAWDRANQPGVTNLLGIYCAVKGLTPDQAVAEFAGKGYGDFKSTVADAVVAELEPIQQRFAELIEDKAELDKILAKGAEKANQQAQPIVEMVKDIMGFVK